MNISKPDTGSPAYKQFIQFLNQKVSMALNWLDAHKIEYTQNYTINNHLYRIYIIEKDLLLDFEYYPEMTTDYNYIRINYDTDIHRMLETLFPETILDTQELTVWKLNRRSCNRFLRENGVSPIYDNKVLRIAYVKDTTIYQCIILKDDRIVANVTRQNCSVKLGTYMLLRYLTEEFGVDKIQISVSLGNSYNNVLYQILGLPCTYRSNKKKIWWNANKCLWKINAAYKSDYVPFYIPEVATYVYSK